MKRKWMIPEAAILSLVSAWSSVGCLITALRLEVVLDTRMALVWTAACLATMALLCLRKGGRICLLLTLLGLAGAWHFLPLQEQLHHALGSAAQIYDRAYGWGIPEILRDAQGDSTLPMTIWGILVTQSVVCAVFRRHGTPLAAGLLVLSLAACLVVTNTVPEPICLFALLGCLALLLLTESVRAEGGYQGSRLTAAAILPVLLTLGLLFYLVPQSTYVNRTEPVRQQFSDYVEALLQKARSGGLHLPSYDRRRDSVDLTSLPSQPEMGLPVAELLAEITGPVYLRVQDFDEYTGSGWISTPNRQETLSGTGDALGAVVIRELSTQTGMLLPSYPAGNTLLSNGIAENESGEKVYRFARTASAMTATPAGSCLKLPEGTGTRARAMVQQFISENHGVEASADAIADFVQRSAQYSRVVQPMPADTGDFALWFLDSADRGYCVHFATAAVVLLRSAGIPARYVTGYRADAVAGQTIRVTSDDAHAWAEYYNYKTWSWSILEATPASLDLMPEETEGFTEPQTLPAATAPTETIPQTEPSTVPQPEPERRTAIPLWLPLTLLGTAFTACGIELQRILRIRLRQRRQRRGPSNRRAIARWEELAVLHRLLDRPLPEALEALAQKAMFSQHTLTREELNAFGEDARVCRAALNAKPWYQRLYCRYWYAVI